MRNPAVFAGEARFCAARKNEKMRRAKRAMWSGDSHRTLSEISHALCKILIRRRRIQEKYDVRILWCDNHIRLSSQPSSSTATKDLYSLLKKWHIFKSTRFVVSSVDIIWVNCVRTINSTLDKVEGHLTSSSWGISDSSISITIICSSNSSVVIVVVATVVATIVLSVTADTLLALWKI